jgi:hypothetical protein
VTKVIKVIRESVVNKVLPDKLFIQIVQEMETHRVHKALRVHKVPQVKTVSTEKTVLMEKMDHQVEMEKMVHKVQLVHKDRQEKME